MMTEHNIFKIGNIVTTNDTNALLILAVNDYQICVQDLLNEDFSVLTKTEHAYNLFDPKVVLYECLKETVNELDISKQDKEHILNGMYIVIDKFILK